MPTNLLKRYNELLELGHLSVTGQRESLARVFERDFAAGGTLHLTAQPVYPVPGERDGLQQLFWHLTTQTTEKATNHREFDMPRAMRLHWVRGHIEGTIAASLVVFTDTDNRPNRTYILNEAERYTVVLEPRSNGTYYLLTAYYLDDRNFLKLQRRADRAARDARRSAKKQESR